jgi:predicted metal-dependent enzyme (double-stranded beta helix superfamily)
MSNMNENDNNYIVTDDSICQNYSFSDSSFSTIPYRLYRFITEIEDTINRHFKEEEIIKILIPKVRKLLTESDWIQFEYSIPDVNIGWSVNMLYDEPNFPLTIQMVTWLPEQISPIHNHGTWGIIAILSGEEKNTFWQKDDNNVVKKIGEKTLSAEDIIGFTSNAIHQVKVMGDEPVISFNLYGITDFKSRFEFDFIKQTAKNF